MKKNLITRIGRLMAMPLAVAALVACNEENIVDNTQMDAVGISVAMTGTAETVTRATTLPSGDLKLLYGSLTSLQTAIYTGSGTSWSSTAPLYWQQLASEQGKYPFYAVSPSDADMTAVPADQSTADAAKASDLLMAFAEPSYKSTIALNFQHALSMVEVNLTNGGGMTDAELSTALLTIDGLQTQYTVAGTTATASGTAANGLMPLKNGANFQFIAPAQQLATSGLTMNFTVTINGVPVVYTYQNPADLTLVDGKKTVFNISVSKTAIQVDVAVEDWTTGESRNETLTIAITGTADQVTGTAGNITELHITPFAEKQISKEYAAANTHHTYTKGNDGTWTSNDPIYLDNLTAGSVLYALAYNKDANGNQIQDAKTRLNDFLGTDAVSVKGGTAAFTLRHLLAQMTINLVAGTGFSADLTDATISTPTMTFEHKLGTDANGNMVMNEVTSNSGKYVDITSGATHIVVPQTLAANSIFTVTLANGNTYEATLTEAVTLAAGVNTTITLTLMPTKVGVSAAVTPWGEAAAAATVQLAGITAGDVSVTAAEGDQLTITYAQDNLTAIYTYANSAWGSTAPLYWDDITKSTFTGNFTAEYVFATKTVPVEDKLVGTITNAAYGSALSFNLAHTTSKMTFTFKGDGTTTTDEEVAAFTKTITLGDATHTIIADAMHFAPQALTDDNTIVLTRPNGNTYTVKLGELKDAQQAAIFGTNGIEAGKHYQITLTVNETSVGISATIAEWTDVSGSGTVTPDFQ
ncbi:MAG: fimbrillin family protein [Bacteroidaceae bacterium]|nr:fimbrillin family protein [Bacteroidaceae bacterium]